MELFGGRFLTFQLFGLRTYLEFESHCVTGLLRK